MGYGLLVKNNNADELLQKYSRIFGFGSKTGVDLPYEDAGLFRIKNGKKNILKTKSKIQSGFPGDTVNMAIGQGDMLATPLQMAQAYSIIVNRGLEYTPHLIKEVKDARRGNFSLSFQAMSL